MPSLTDVARVAGVSLTTASMVLNKGKQHNRVSVACAKRVQEAALTLGYVPNYHARSMKLGRAEVLAVAMDLGYESFGAGTDLELNNPYFGHLIGGIEMRTRALGYLMTLVGPEPRSRAPDRALLGVRQRRFDGIIVPGSLVRGEMTSFLDEPADVPVVVIQPPGETPHPAVVFDERAGVDLAVKHLAELGHRRLMFVGGPGLTDARRDGEREEGFRAACRARGLEFEVLAVTGLGAYEARHPERRIGQVVADVSAVVASGRFGATGVVAYDDVTAIGVIEALQSAGLSVPRDVSVVGFDDTVARYAVPRLTTVSHELSEMGRVATDLCMEMVNAPESIARLRGSRTVVEPRLVVRQSTAAPRAGRG